MIPPALPLIQSLEVFANLYFFAGLAWAWSTLGVFVAGKARSSIDPAVVEAARAKWAPYATTEAALERRLTYEGTYLDTRSSVVLAVFLAVGTGVFLWYKIRTQPSAATFPCVLSCILMDVGCQAAALSPRPLYTSGLLFFLPMAIQGGVGILASLIIFPESVSHSFLTKFPAVFQPLSLALDHTLQLFDQVADSDDKLGFWAEHSRGIRQHLLKSLDAITPIRAQKRYLKLDISYSLISPADCHDLFDQLAAVQARSGGLAFFFDVIVTNICHKHIDSRAWTVYEASRPATPESVPGTPNVPSRSSSVEHLSAHPLQRGSHFSFLDAIKKQTRPVGLWESHRYMDVERMFTRDTDDALEQLDTLADTGRALVSACHGAVNVAIKYFGPLARSSRGPLGDLGGTIKTLDDALEQYRTRRLEALASYRRAFATGEEEEYRRLHFRNLFQSFVAQYHLIEFAESILDLLQALEKLKTLRTKRRIWLPRFRDLLAHTKRVHVERDPNENADEPGHEGSLEEDNLLGAAKRRDPESTPYDSVYLNALSRLAGIPAILGSRSFFFFIKAAILTSLTILPQFFKSSAGFYYYNRGIWCTIMSQFTLAVFAGDTAGAWIARVIASFWGAVLGMVVWYIGSGSSSGNPYGIAAICAVTFPAVMFFRIHFPGQLLTAVMTSVTFALVIGYSYLNGSLTQLTDVSWGWSVAWRRFVCVMIGITAAYIFSYLPPAFSSKRAIRQSYAMLIAHTGVILCEILSQANTHEEFMGDDATTRDSVLACRTRLAKLGARHTNAKLEYSLKGRWPEERYQALLEALRDSLLLLHQLHHVLRQMNRPWRKLLLNRIRFDDPTFLGDVLAVFSMTSTGLASGTALPQITPSPLVARYRMGKTRGLDLPSQSHDSSLPAFVTVEVLESQEYMRYALGITTTFSLLARIDRIVVICKTLLGENYHVGGLHF